MERPVLIAIEGPIGVGKTTLALRLAETLGGATLLEAPEENPFLARFYANPRSAALPAQLSFLFQRVLQYESLHQADLFAPVRVADFLLEKDRLFAELNLQGHELALYRQVWENLAPAPVPADLVVYLQAPAAVLLERIARRGIDYEQNIARGYLERLNEAYARFFHGFDQAPLLIVNAAAIDPIHNEHDYDALLQAIHGVMQGQSQGAGRERHYFDPERGANHR